MSKAKWEPGTFITVPNKKYIYNLPNSVLRVYLAICDYTDGRGECWPSYETLADRAQCSRRNVIKQVCVLEAAGLITITRKRKENGENYTNRYKIVELGSVSTSTTPSVTQGTTQLSVQTSFSDPLDTTIVSGQTLKLNQLTNPLNQPKEKEEIPSKEGIVATAFAVATPTVKKRGDPLLDAKREAANRLNRKATAVVRHFELMMGRRIKRVNGGNIPTKQRGAAKRLLKWHSLDSIMVVIDTVASDSSITVRDIASLANKWDRLLHKTDKA